MMMLFFGQPSWRRKGLVQSWHPKNDFFVQDKTPKQQPPQSDWNSLRCFLFTSDSCHMFVYCNRFIERSSYRSITNNHGNDHLSIWSEKNRKKPVDSHLKTVERPINLYHHINESGRRLPNPPCHIGVRVFGLSFCFLVGGCQVNPPASSSLDPISFSQRSHPSQVTVCPILHGKDHPVPKGCHKITFDVSSVDKINTKLPNRILLEFQPFFVVRSNSLRLVGCC